MKWLVTGIVICLAFIQPALAEQWPSECRDLLQQNQQQFSKMREHTDLITQSVKDLNKSLLEAESLNQNQAQQIVELEHQIAYLRARDPEIMRKARAFFFRRLALKLEPSPVYQLENDRLIISADDVYIYGKAEIGAEGISYLEKAIKELVTTANELPTNLAWRLQFEGHTDSRPLRSHNRFANNWELSAARALGMLQLFSRVGVPDYRMQAVGLAATRMRDEGSSKKAHKHNRRIEIHLVADR